MNPNMAKWSAALESGEYKQTSSYLRDKDGFCCLGVACDVYAKETGLGKWDNEDGATHFYFLGKRATLPLEVSSWLGIPDRLGDPQLVVNSRARTIVQLNDEDRLTFREIAKILRQNFDKELQE